MNLARVILGPVVTEKAERLKAAPRRTHTLRIAPQATKVDVKKSLERFYDVQVARVRIMHTGAKRRPLPTGQMMEKRHPSKKALVTLTKESKALDLASFKTS